MYTRRDRPLLQRVRNEPNKAEKEKLSKELGVVDEGTVNPLCKHVHINVIPQIGSDMSHHDFDCTLLMVLLFEVALVALWEIGDLLYY